MCLYSPYQFQSLFQYSDVVFLRKLSLLSELLKSSIKDNSMNNLMKNLTSYNLVSLTRKMTTAHNINPNRLKGKVAVVTASTEGIGFAIAERLARDGAKVVISSRKEANVKAALNKLKGLSVAGVKCHVGNSEDRKQLFEEAVKQFGGIDILISNAAVNPQAASVLDTDEIAWDKIFDINVKCSYLLAKEALPYLRQRGGGSILFVSSIGGLQPFDLLGAYSVSKTALLGLTKAASLQLANENIRVNCLAPGIVITKFSAALHSTDDAREAALTTIPMKRLAEPHEMGGVASFLVSDDASYMTGEIIVAAGGMQSRL